MRAYGSDRLRPVDDGSVILSSRLEKGWYPRVPKQLTKAEHPGTAVLWDDEYWEVVTAEALPQGGMRYTLAPWKDEHAIRVADRYDDESELARAEEHRKNVAHNAQRKTANALGLLTGHLPASVQEHLGRELGILPVRLTMLSLLLSLAVIIVLVMIIVHAITSGRQTPLAVGLGCIYLFLETLVRYFIVWTQARPIGSSVGMLVYLLWWGLAPKNVARVSPFAVEKGWNVHITEAPPDVARQDAFTTREPLVTLLPRAEQLRLAELYPYDYRKESTKFAVRLLIGAAFGIWSTLVTLQHGPNLVVLSSFLLASAVAIEQVVRILLLRRGPTGSMFAFLVRPFVRRLFQ